MRFPLRYKLTGIILIIFLPLIALSIHHYFELIEHDKQEVINHNHDKAESITIILDDEISEAFALLETLSKHPAVIEKNLRECDSLFARLLPLYPVFYRIVAVDREGLTYCSSDHSPAGRRFNHKNSSWFQKALGGTHIIDDVSSFSQIPTIIIAKPIFDNRNKQIAVIGLSLNLKRLSNDIAKRMSSGDKSSIIVIDSKGAVIMDTLHAE